MSASAKIAAGFGASALSKHGEFVHPRATLACGLVKKIGPQILAA